MKYGERQWHLNKIQLEKHFCNKSELTREKRREILKHLCYWGYTFLDNIQTDELNEIIYVQKHYEHIIIYINEIGLQLNDKEIILNQVAKSLAQAEWHNSKKINDVIDKEIDKYIGDKNGKNNQIQE